MGREADPTAVTQGQVQVWRRRISRVNARLESVLRLMSQYNVESLEMRLVPTTEEAIGKLERAVKFAEDSWDNWESSNPILPDEFGNGGNHTEGDGRE